MNKVIARVTAVALVATITAAGGDFAILNLRVVEGEGLVYGTGSRATRGLTVEVVDEAGRAVADVTISFRLPEDGPSGVFATGSRTEVMTTRQDGRASVWGMRWNRTPGPVQVRITAMKDGVRAGLVSTQYLTEAAASAPRGGAAHGGRSKIILISLAVAGAAGAGLALGASRGGQSPTVAPVIPLSIGKPSVIVGAPSGTP